MKKFDWMISPDPIPEENISVYREADIVIIGAGHAGTCAARAAAEEGASVAVVEQQDDAHQWILGIGELGYMNSKWQAAHGVPEVDIDTFVNDWQLRTNNRSNYRLIRKYAQECGSCFDWLIEPLSEEEKESIHPMMTPQSPNAPKMQNYIHAWTGTPNLGMQLMRKVMKCGQAIARKNGAEFFFGTRALQLTTEKRMLPDGQKRNKVTGVIVQFPDGRFGKISARKGVLLAAGDYSKNKEMCEDLLAESADLIDEGDWSGHGWDGSGIRMGVWAGGRLEPRSHAAVGGNYSFPGFDTIGSTATLRLNTHGKRYSNEGFGNHVLAALAGARQPNGMLWGIFDSDILEETTYQAPCNASFDYTDPNRVRDLKNTMQKALEHKGQQVMHRDVAGDVRPFAAADTVEELAAVIYDKKEDQDNMIRAVSRYNELCGMGKDIDFGKEPFLLHPIRKGPFFATGQYKNSHKPFGQSMKLLVTVSGLLTDENQNVLDADFEPLQGLFATGNCCGGRFGLHYSTSIPGQSISMAQTLGRAAGKWIANLEDG